jgi:ferredoxin
MANSPKNIVICSCEDTMRLDTAAVERGCRNGEIKTFRHLCRAEIERFRDAAGAEGPLTVACTQEAPLFGVEAGERPGGIEFVNIRETAGWSKQGAAAGPKMAALLAAAAEPVPAIPFVTLSSDGVILIYGRDEQAIEAGYLLKDHLDVTVLIKPPADVSPPRVTDFPVVRGAIRSAKGYLGKFELTVDGYAQPAPSSRGAFSFPTTRDGAVSRCDLVLDLSGGAPLFTASDLRDGYLRADPGDPAAVLKAVLKARDLVGSFDKPRYVAFTADLCAHSRSKIVGCTRCLDLCPTGAIAPAGDHVAIDAYICAGCGQCAAVCPTGAAAYALPPADALMRKLRSLVTTYRDAGGTQPAVVLMHDEAHGVPLIDALARFGDGLPANVLPIAVNEVTQIGLEAIAAAFAYGAAAVRVLLRARPRHAVAAGHRHPSSDKNLEIAAPDAPLQGICHGVDSGQHFSILPEDWQDVTVLWPYCHCRIPGQPGRLNLDTRNCPCRIRRTAHAIRRLTRKAGRVTTNDRQRTGAGRPGGAVGRLLRRAAAIIAECNDAQQRMIELWLSVDHGRAPDTYAEFLLRTSGKRLREPAACDRGCS